MLLIAEIIYYGMLFFTVTNCWEWNRSITLWKKVQWPRIKDFSPLSCALHGFCSRNSHNIRRLIDMCPPMFILSPWTFVCPEVVTNFGVNCCYWTWRRESNRNEILSNPIKLSSLKQQAAFRSKWALGFCQEWMCYKGLLLSSIFSEAHNWKEVSLISNALWIISTNSTFLLPVLSFTFGIFWLLILLFLEQKFVFQGVMLGSRHLRDRIILFTKEKRLFKNLKKINWRNLSHYLNEFEENAS